MKRLCIIPARGGSKRIPRKNIKHFLGKPIIAYSIKVALQSKLFDEVMVSTDDKEIAEICIELGGEVPFFRTKNTADDYAVLADVISEVIESYSKVEKEFDEICCILPTAPFVTSDAIVAAYKKLLESSFDSVFPVLQFSFPIQRALKMEKGKVSLMQQEHLNTRSQDLEPMFHDAGQFYWINTQKFKSNQKLYTKNSGAIIISALEAQDIDTETDWKLAEIKYNLIRNG